jgi:proton-translocating NADH-quinone oxidoreductase chain N
MPTPFPLPPSSDELRLLAPEIVLVAAGLFLLAVEMLWPRRTRAVGVLAVLFLALALAAEMEPWRILTAREAGGVAPFFAPPQSALTAFHGNVVVDGFSLTMKAIVLVGSLLAALMGLRYAERFRNPGEFFAMLLFGTGAASLLTGAADLLMIYLSVEFLSITSYVLAGYLKHQPRSTEAALKYFLYGAVTAAVMLYGLSLLYGLSGTTNLYALVSENDNRSSFVEGINAAMGKAGGAGVVLVALVLVLTGFGFKTAMAPFHQWAPDVYDGAPLPVMAWLSVASQAAGMAVLARVLYAAFPHDLWVTPLAALAALTMTAGNLAALPQASVKRMLAYSSIAHAGYTLMGVAALGAGGGDGLGQWQATAAAVYLATYVFSTVGALAVVTAVYDRTKSHRIEDYAGLSQRAPGLAWLMLFFLLSLTGIPPTAGFWGKFVLFASVLRSPGLGWLALVGLVNTVVSGCYYWGVVRAMFVLKAKTEEEVAVTWDLKVVLTVTAAATLAIFLFAEQFMWLFAGR